MLNLFLAFTTSSFAVFVGMALIARGRIKTSQSDFMEQAEFKRAA